MNPIRPDFLSLAGRTAVVHTVSYFVVGIVASQLMDYTRLFAQPEMSCYMRQMGDPWLMAGPLVQPVRGVIFATVFYLLRDRLFGNERGWLTMWWMLVAFGILSTFGPAPASVEGLVYTRVPWSVQLIGLPEVLVQALLLSSVLHLWVRRPQWRWLGWSLSAAFALVLALPAVGLLMPPR